MSMWCNEWDEGGHRGGGAEERKLHKKQTKPNVNN